MENKVSLKGRLFGLCLFLIGSTFLIIYGSELLMDKLAAKSHTLGPSYHWDRIYRFLNLYLRAKYYILYELGIKKLITIAVVALISGVIILRKLTKLYYYKVLPFFLGQTFKVESHEFRHIPFNVFPYVKKKSDDDNSKNLKRDSLHKRTFLGLTGKKKIFSLTEEQRSKHIEVIGKSGTGKTKSVLVPIAAQDMMIGKSVVIVNGKGDRSFPAIINSLADAVHRSKDFRFFNLANPDNSHTYNPVHLGRYGDPLIVADRMFSVLGYKNEYYSDLAFNFFRNLVCILAETGQPFNLNDIYICVCSKEARDYVCQMSSAKQNIKLLEWSLESVERHREDLLSGLKTKLEFYRHDLLNSYNPDIVLEDVVENDRIVFLSLNINMMPNLAPAVAKLFLRDLQQHIGGRQADASRNQKACSIILDEFSTFIYKDFHVAISQFREGNAQLTFSHQSGNDLNLSDKELGSVVWDNSQTKIILAQDDSMQCQKISEMIGTHKVIERTERYKRGFMFIRKPTFETSNKYVDAFLFHPNKIKRLEPCGQGYVLTTKEPHSVIGRGKKGLHHSDTDSKENLRITGVNFGMFSEAYSMQPSVGRKPYVDGLNLTGLFLDCDIAQPEDDNYVDRQGVG